MDASLTDRIKRIQKHLELNPDGVMGPATLTALEARFFVDETGVDQIATSLLVSQRGLKQLIDHEISSAAYYKKHLRQPMYPGGQSGVTIGIGYDLGYNSASQIRRDWGGQIGDMQLEKLLVVCGLKGPAAKSAVRGVRQISIELAVAESVYYQATLPRYAAMTRKAYPGIENLYADAQAGLLSLVYNRGVRMSGSHRREMKAIKTLVVQQDYEGIAEQVKAMKRLWEGKGLAGLLKRRDDEAQLIAHANRDYSDPELVKL